MAAPLDFNPSYSHYWSADSQDALFGVHFNSLLPQFTGFSVCHPTYDEQTMNLSLRHNIYSAILKTEATVFFNMAFMLHMRDTKKWVCAYMCARTHTASP